MIPCRRRRDRRGRRGGEQHGIPGTVLTPSLHTPCPAPPCILLLLERTDLTSKGRVDVTGHGLLNLSHSGISGAVNRRGKMMCKTSSHDITAQ